MKIWGVSYGLIGDLIMGLPVLTYFEKKYPGSYKYWAIEKKVSQCAMLFFNHPLIDRIKITDEWGGFGKTDKELIKNCEITCTISNWSHSSDVWYNHYNCVEETAKIAGIHDLTEVLTKEEMIPKLYQWFNLNTEANNAYLPEVDTKKENKKVIAIWPFAAYATNSSRSPDELWWRLLILELCNKNYEVWHFGMPQEPDLSDNKSYKRFTNLSFFDQIRTVLLSNFLIGTDSGSSWVTAAYGHQVFCMNTEWQPNHYQNLDAMSPIGPNVETVHKLSNKKLFEAIERFENEV
jgi:ADP-heptose:LPS heptosyltransferase